MFTTNKRIGLASIIAAMTARAELIGRDRSVAQLLLDDYNQGGFTVRPTFIRTAGPTGILKARRAARKRRNQLRQKFACRDSAPRRWNGR